MSILPIALAPWPVWSLAGDRFQAKQNLSKSNQAWQAQQPSMTARQPCKDATSGAARQPLSLAMRAAHAARPQARANAAGERAIAPWSAVLPAPVVLAPVPFGVLLLLLLLALPDQHVVFDA